MDQLSAAPAPSPDKASWWRAAPLAGVWLLVVTTLSLRGHVPLTYDEAFNFTDVASRGVGYVISHYPNPNNHVAFTALQAISLPATLVETWPPLLRIPNLLVGAALLALLVSHSARFWPLPSSRRTSWWPAAICSAPSSSWPP